MKKYNYYGKTIEEAKKIAFEDLNQKEENLIIKEKEIKTGLFKTKKIEIEAIKKSDVIDFIKDTIFNITKSMGIESKFEIKERKENITVTIFSDNNNILIGKQGRTIDALSIIVKQSVYNELGFYYNFLLDVGEYKVKQQKNLERLVKSIAREVLKTKIEVKLDSMNSYERRIVHSILSENNKIKTESIGEEPNRCVIIKPI